MNLSAKDVGIIRDRIHNLDLQNPEDFVIYVRYRRLFLIEGEGMRRYAYDDATGKPIKPGVPIQGKVTVGIGFNMSRKEEAEKEWLEAFRGAVDFEAVKSGQRALTEKEVGRLLEVSLGIREVELKNAYGAGVWHRLRANERLAIESAYFNAPKLVKRGTQFYAYMTSYYQTGEEIYLLKASIELGEKSNRTGHLGLACRRLTEALLLNSTKCPLYSRPVDPLCPERSITAVLGKTILPRGVDAWEKPHLDDARFYIWRTKQDDRVRETHEAWEGKVFPKDRLRHAFPGDDYNCRCRAEPLPYLIKVQTSTQKSSYTPLSETFVLN
jgi:hypothetical protein